MGDKRIIISGASGLIGSALVESLRSDGFEVATLVRRPIERPGEIEWCPGEQPLDPAALEGAEAVVNLNGASIGRLPWTRRYRRVLSDSRVLPTRTLATAIRQLGADAPTFISASAAGFYGDRPSEVLTERSSQGSSFLARLCVAWEREALNAGPDVRVTLLRTASLLHPEAVLKPLVLLTRLGLGGPLGSGRQVWPWMSLEDEVRAIRHIIDQGITGAVNLCAPVATTANEIGAELARQLHRPFWVPAPAWALRCALGRVAADNLLLADARVTPEVLENSGFEFRYPNAGTAIAAALSGGPRA